ncbi:putative leader peptide [Pseudonocardia acaciae]
MTTPSRRRFGFLGTRRRHIDLLRTAGAACRG